MKESKRHVGAALLELQYREPGPENIVGAIGSVKCRKMRGKNLYSKCNELETGGHDMIGQGPTASTLKDMPVRTQHARS